MPLPTLDDFKRHLNMNSTSDDAELSDVLAAAVDVVEGAVGPLRQKSYTETHYGVSTPALVLRRCPVSAVTALNMRLYSGTDGLAILADDVALDPELGVLRLGGGYRFRGDVTVTYTAGFDTVPSAVWLATLMIGKQMWDTQRGSQPLPLQGADEQPTFQSFAPGIPDRARVLLEPYLRGSQVA